MKRLILYDLDGTLVDTLDDIAQAVNHLRDADGLPALPSHEIRRSVGRGVRELVASCLKISDAACIEQASRQFQAYYAQHLADHSRLYPGVQALLDYFQTRRQAVVTNKPNPHARDLLRRLGIDRYFVHVIAGDDGYPKKPDPAAVFAMMDQERVTPAETVFIGDNPIDIETGRNAGVLTVGVAQGFSEVDDLAAASPDVLVHHCDELLAYAKAHQW